MVLKSLLKKWEKSSKKLSGNDLTNDYLPQNLRKELLKEDLSLSKNLSFKKINFPKLNSPIDKIKGLNILSGLQKINKKGCLTLFRAVRFPTIKRIHEVVYDKGFSITNYEQERILDLYEDRNYISKRQKIKKDKIFWIQPQERVVHGVPLFYLVNDTLQINRGFRSTNDRILLIAIHIPIEAIKKEKVKVYANLSIDINYKNNKRDIQVKDFISKNGCYYINIPNFNIKGIDLHELYFKGICFDLEDAQKLGITQDFFLLDIYKINEKDKKIRNLFDDTKTLKKNQNFLYGFFGNYTLFARPFSEYLPFECYRINKTILVPKNLFKKYQIDPGWFKRNPNSLHGILHEYRVLVYSYLIGKGEKVNIPPLCHAAMFHDVRRYNDGFDIKHSERASNWVEKEKKIPNKDLVRYLIYWHVPSDDKAPKMVKELKCFKDADTLDRWRIGDFDPRYLRTQTAKSLIDFSKRLFEITEKQKDSIKDARQNVMIALKKMGCIGR